MTRIAWAAWVLQLKKKISNEHYEGKTLYLRSDDSVDFLTEDLSRADIYYDKEEWIEIMKKHDEIMISEYGENSIRNIGWENIWKYFDFVEVEVTEVDENEMR